MKQEIKQFGRSILVSALVTIVILLTILMLNSVNSWNKEIIKSLRQDSLKIEMLKDGTQTKYKL